jgi:hypothetical protein
VVAGAVAAAVSALGYSLWRELNGETISGTVHTVGELPFAQEIVEELAPEGDLEYVFSAARGGYQLVVSGTSTQDAVHPFPNTHLYVTGSADGARKRLGGLADDGEVFMDYSSDDIRLAWRSPKGYVDVYYRPSDGRFTLVLVGLRQDREEWLPMEGDR